MAALPLLLGHRGARAVKSVPENTLRSFDLALEHGCNGFEFDVRLTADGEAVVCHDSIVSNHEVCRLNRSQLPDCPVLEQVLHRYADLAFLDIELKVDQLESVVLNALREHRPQRDYVISSFLPEVLMELKARSAGVPIGLICDNASHLARWRQLPVDCVIAERKLVSEELIAELHAANRKAMVWTVNDPASMLRFAGWGADGIIADNTDLLVKTLLGSKAMGYRGHP